MENTMKYLISLNFHEIKLPPFDEILILGKNSPHGKHGISKSFELLLPNGFDIIDVNEGVIEAVFINKRIVAKLPTERLLKILRDKVFPYVSEGELVKVDLKVSISYNLTEENL